MPGTDWDQLKIEYVMGSMTLKELAAAHGVNRHTVESRSRKEKWGEARRKNHGRITANALARYRAREAKRLSSLQQAGTRMCAQLEKLMADANRQLYTRASPTITGEWHETRLETVDDRKLLNLSKSIETMARAMRSLYDIQSAAETAQTELTRAQTERVRADTQREKEDGRPNEIEIRYGGIEGTPDDYRDG